MFEGARLVWGILPRQARRKTQIILKNRQNITPKTRKIANILHQISITKISKIYVTTHQYHN